MPNRIRKIANRFNGWVSKKGLATTLASAAILAAAAFQIDHYARAGDDHELLAQSVKTQSTMAEVVEVLAERHKVQDMRAAFFAELCRAGKLEGADCAAVVMPPPSD